jgi:hypothetical protein
MADTVKKKYFVSCAVPGRKIGAMQFESTDQEFQAKAEAMCPERAFFKAYELSEGFDEDIPVDEFIPAAKLKELGY